MLLSQTLGRSVINVEDAQQIGAVEELVIDPASAQIVAIRLKGAKDAGGGTVAWQDVQAVGPDAVMVHAARTARLSPVDAEVQKDLVGKRVLTERGEEIGKLTDVAFDPVTGRVEGLQTARGLIPGHSMLGVGAYALVVRAQTSPPPPAG
ncbi:PRC-barrel domain-containing protein [Streptomyces sp. NPDC056670]|uniref:PRC-barrel domain-containing protein n=1 Tax=Streptomyces sp. NPDC056670 TaxID=3345904 RepID=UPI0036914B24